jgi:hypothetical protein
MSSLTSIDPEKKLRSHCPQFTSVQIHHIMCMHLLKIEKEGKNNLQKWALVQNRMASWMAPDLKVGRRRT